MASKDLQTLRMEAFTKMARSGRGLIDEITKETPSEKREEAFNDFKKRALFSHNLKEEAMYGADKALRDIKHRAMIAEMEFAEQYSASDATSAGLVKSASDFETTKGFFNKDVEPGQHLGWLFGIKKFKHQTMEGEMMTTLGEKMTILQNEMINLKRFEAGKAKYGGRITGKDAERIAALKEEVNYLHSKFSKDSWITDKMQKRRGTKDATTRSTYNDYVNNIEAYKAYLDSLGR